MDSDRRPLLKSASTDVVISNQGPIQGKANTLVSNHFHSVKSFFLFLSARPRDFDGMLGIRLPGSMYTVITPIDMWRFKLLTRKQLNQWVLVIKLKSSLQKFYHGPWICSVCRNLNPSFS
jgi:hypothetical protein